MVKNKYFEAPCPIGTLRSPEPGLRIRSLWETKRRTGYLFLYERSKIAFYSAGSLLRVGYLHCGLQADIAGAIVTLSLPRCSLRPSGSRARRRPHAEGATRPARDRLRRHRTLVETANKRRNASDSPESGGPQPPPRRDAQRLLLAASTPKHASCDQKIPATAGRSGQPPPIGWLRHSNRAASTLRFGRIGRPAALPLRRAEISHRSIGPSAGCEPKANCEAVARGNFISLCSSKDERNSSLCERATGRQ